MNRRKIAIWTINIFSFLIWIGLIGAVLWPLTSLYEPLAAWWGGNSGIRATEWVVWGPLLGVVGMIVHVRVLSGRKRISLRLGRRALMGAALVAGTLTAFCLPYFVIPHQVGVAARSEFAATWGADWESRIQVPAQGPWLATSYCLFAQYGNLPYTDDMFTTETNVEFYNNGVDSFKVDVHLPHGLGPYPALIDIHGGGWCAGDKGLAFEYQQEYFAAAGYCVFDVQYGAKEEAGRTRQYSMEEIMANLAKFSDWIAQPAISDHYKLNISAVFTNGFSAGGHLSMLLGVARTNVSVWNPAVHVIGAINFYGIADLRHWDMLTPWWFNWTGLFNETVFTNYSIIDRFSPMTYVEAVLPANPDIVPLLVFHGDADSVVAVTQSQELDAMCDARGRKCIYIEIPRGEHCFEGDSNSGPTQVTLWAMERFMMLCRS